MIHRIQTWAIIGGLFSAAPQFPKNLVKLCYAGMMAKVIICDLKKCWVVRIIIIKKEEE